MANKDWKDGKLLGAKYAIVGDSVHLVFDTKQQVRETWEKIAEKLGWPKKCPEELIKQVCIVLPPWETPNA